MGVLPRKRKGKIVRGRGRGRFKMFGQTFEEAFTGTKSEAKVVEAQLRTEAEARGPVVDRIAPEFSNFLMGRYALYADKHEKKNTKDNRKYQYALLDQFFGDIRIDRTTRRDIEDFQTWRLEGNPVRNPPPVKIGTDAQGNPITRPRIIKPAGPPKINDDCKVLSVVLHYAYQELKFRSMVPKAKPLPEPMKNDRVKVWTADEVSELYAAMHATARNLLPMTICLINTGMRSGEAIAMPWDWVDLDRGMIEIQPNEYWQPKNGKPRDVPIADVLRPWLEIPVEERPKDKDGRPSKFVFPCRKATGYKNWPQNTWDRGRDLSGVGGSPHVCRHTYASHFLANYNHHEKGDALFVLSKILGHAHAKVTAIYSHLLPDRLEAARNVVNLAPGLRDISLK